MFSYFQSLAEFMAQGKLAPWAQKLSEQIASGLSQQRYGDLSSWLEALESLPTIKADFTDLRTSVTIGSSDEIDTKMQEKITHCLRALIPWRKGPFSVFGINIDTEWRSDWKWERLSPHISPLEKRLVLDVGCGNGYHCLRMLGAGANRVIGIDPSPRFTVQFLMLKHFLGDIAVDVVPISMEELPYDLQSFDTTFSMGVLYHRRSPMDHLRELKASLKPGGELILETLIIKGKQGEVLVPEGRYSMMRNVWFIPSSDTLISWLRKVGFTEPRLIDTNRTSTDEQRATDWMRFQSLKDFLDPDNPHKTVEGHPAPLRALFVAKV